MTVAFDTQQLVQELMHNKTFSKTQAETLVKVLRETTDTFVTRDYLDTRLELLEARLTNKIIAANLAMMLATVALLKYLG